MPNVGSLKQTKRILLSSVVTSVMTYGISIWADALKTLKSRRMAGPIHRLSALRIACAFSTISGEAVCVISRTLPLLVLAEERRTIYHRRLQQLSPEKLRLEERQNSIDRWRQL
ncbi:uncharacterized protein LOC113387863 [Ctenocephalides felis]|uniref:uncharacterized protein LOC113387863 n=1 Tax=Ctenocephalides felis TaxID=7515 RepID=UPI000E6E354F|nr:uncharacterized protein LOC113387863 [Ctenocephalides felis]